MGYPIIFKQLDYFLVQQLTRKLAAAQKPKKSQNFGYPLSVFSKYLPIYKSYAIVVFTY